MMAMSVNRRIGRNLFLAMGHRDPESMIRSRSTDPIRACGLVPRRKAGHMTAIDPTMAEREKSLRPGGHPHMARTHPFAETGARPKPHATEGVTPASMPPATPAVRMRCWRPRFRSRSAAGCRRQTCPLISLRPARDAGERDLPSGAPDRRRFAVPGRATHACSGQRLWTWRTTEQRRSLLCRRRSRAAGDATLDDAKVAPPSCSGSPGTARNGGVIEQSHGRGVPGCPQSGWAMPRKKMAVGSLLNALALSELH